jgi:hypothetical protein
MLVLILLTGVASYLALPPLLASFDSPLQVESLGVEHFAGPQANARSFGLLGKDSFEPVAGEAVRVQVELSAARNAYVLSFDANGQETLLWPTDDQGVPDPKRRPSHQKKIEVPASGGKPLVLQAQWRGGLQAIVVAASRLPLPEYSKWKKERREVYWPARLPAGRHVWTANRDGAFLLGPEFESPHGPGKKGPPPPPPLAHLALALCSGGVEVVEAIGFGVRPGPRP